MVERHFALSRHSFVHHIECSREPPEFAEMVRIARREESLAPYAERLPRSAFEASYGMTDMEKSFLKDHTYGTDYLKAESNRPLHRTGSCDPVCDFGNGAGADRHRVGTLA